MPIRHWPLNKVIVAEVTDKIRDGYEIDLKQPINSSYPNYIYMVENITSKFTINKKSIELKLTKENGELVRDNQGRILGQIFFSGTILINIMYKVAEHFQREDENITVIGKMTHITFTRNFWGIVDVKIDDVEGDISKYITELLYSKVIDVDINPIGVEEYPDVGIVKIYKFKCTPTVLVHFNVLKIE